MNSIQIIRSILLKTQNNECTVPQDYFVGVTSNPYKRVFDEHNLQKKKSIYAFYEASSELEASKALTKLLNFEMNGFPLNDHIPGKYVYCYLIEGSSKECYASFE